MDAGTEAILRAAGFAPTGQVGYRLRVHAWWSEHERQQLALVPADGGLLLKGSKSYHLVSVSEEGETWARDIGPLHDYLEAHFPEIHLSFSHFRDLSVGMARGQARRLLGQRGPIADRDDLAKELVRRTNRLAEAQRLLAVAGNADGLLGPHLLSVVAHQREEVTRTRDAINEAADTEAAAIRLQEEYLRQGSACSLVFTINSNVQFARSAQDLEAAVRSITAELRDAHRFQVTQKLGGKLKVRVAEATEPGLTWIEQWLGGAFAPRQMDALLTRSAAADALTAHLSVIPKEDIRIDGVVVEQGKRLAARAVGAVLERVDREDRLHQAPDRGAGPTLRLGLQMLDDRATDTSFEPSLSRIVHMVVSGATGSGKSILQRVIAEEVAGHPGLAVLILDPRNQSAGIRLPEDRNEFLTRYPRFGISGARSFDFRYFAPAHPSSPTLPDDLGELAGGRSIVSFKGLDDAERCELFARVLDAAFERRSAHEVGGVKIAVLVEEAQLFTRRLAAERAKSHASRAEAALDRIYREGRKYGVLAIASSQSIMDFSRDAAAIRQNATTKVFMHNSDREVEYVRDYLPDPRVIVRLRPGEAVFCNPAWGIARVAVRPPLSKVWDLSDAETGALLRPAGAQPRAISADADRLLRVVQEHAKDNGAGPNVSQAGQAAGITSRRRLLELVAELVAAGRVRTRRLREQGQPRVIEPVASGHNQDETGTEADTTGGHDEQEGV